MACSQSKGDIPKVVHADEDDIFLNPDESLLTKGQFAACKAVSYDLQKNGQFSTAPTLTAHSSVDLQIEKTY